MRSVFLIPIDTTRLPSPIQYRSSGRPIVIDTSTGCGSAAPGTTYFSRILRISGLSKGSLNDEGFRR
jgi:hypothetical protein